MLHADMATLYNTKKGESHIHLARKKGSIYVGRSSSCDFQIKGVDVSSRHCLFTVAVYGDREYLTLRDLSSNGTSVNDEVMSKNSIKVLRSGDKIDFAKTGGSYIFRYCAQNDILKDNRESFFDHYILGEQLGSGHYAVVKEARDRSTGHKVVVKIFHPSKSKGGSPADDKKLKQEIELLMSVKHPNIVSLISHYTEPVNTFTLTTFLVLEKMNDGELFQRIVNKLKLREDETKAIFRQILSGLQYLHKNNIIHRDIKPENILLDITPMEPNSKKQAGPWDDDEYDVRVKIADFGLAKFIGEMKFTNTLCGTPAYVAPEVLSDTRNYTTKVDMWLAGVLLYVCLCGFPPFSEELAPPNMREQIVSGKYAFYSPYWDEIDDTALYLISSLLVVDPLKRFDVLEAASHSWFKEDQLLLTRQNRGNDKSKERKE